MEDEVAQLKSIFEIPKLYLADFFIDLKSKVDLSFVTQKINLETENKIKWLEIIKRIESFEQDTYKRSSLINQQFKQEINQFESNKSSILELRNKIEKCLFANKTICFIQKSLIIVDDEYMSSNSIYSNPEVLLLTNEKIKVIHLLKTQLRSSLHIIELSLKFNHLKELHLRDSKISQIEVNTFKSLKNLELLDLSFNQLSEINASIFISDLANLIELNLTFRLDNQS